MLTISSVGLGATTMLLLWTAGQPVGLVSSSAESNLSLSVRNMSSGLVLQKLGTRSDRSKCQPFKKVVQRMQQGIQGDVVQLQGNQMPPVSSSAAPKPVSTEVWVFAGQIQGRSPLWSVAEAQNYAKRVVCVHSDAKGKFAIPLAPGEYTVFARYGSNLYLNSFQGDGKYQSVTVTSGKITNLQLVHTQNAVF